MRLLHEHIGVWLGANHQPKTIRWRLSLYQVQAIEAQWIYTGKWWRIPVIPCDPKAWGLPLYNQQSCYRQPCYGQSCYRESCYEQPSYYRLSCVAVNGHARSRPCPNHTSHNGVSLNDRPIRVEIFREGASWVLSRLLGGSCTR